MLAQIEATAVSCWTLIKYGQGQQQKRKIPLPKRNLVVGRTTDSDICVPDASVSKRHAEIRFAGDAMLVVDQESTIGTYRNCERIDSCSVQDGDLLQYGNALYRVGRERRDDAGLTQEQGILPWAQTLLHFDKLLNERAILPFFQPIV